MLLERGQSVCGALIVPHPIALRIVGIDAHDAPVIPMGRSEVRYPRRLPVGHSAYSVRNWWSVGECRTLTEPSVLVKGEGLLHYLRF